jgi:hypothetical protein
MPLNAEQRSLIGRIGAAARAGEDGRKRTQAARDAADRRFYEQTDPALPEDARRRQADALRRQHLDRMRLASVTKAKRARQAIQDAKDAAKQLRAEEALTIRHSLEEQLLESGVNLRDLPRSQLNDLIEFHVPGPSAPESLTLLAAPWTIRSAAPVTVINNAQIINAMESTIIQNVRGTVHLGLQAKDVLTFLEKFGGQDAAALEAAVYELEDPAAPQSAKSDAKRRLNKFLGQIVGLGRDVGAELLADYLKSKGA